MLAPTMAIPCTPPHVHNHSAAIETRQTIDAQIYINTFSTVPTMHPQPTAMRFSPILLLIAAAAAVPYPRLPDAHPKLTDSKSDLGDYAKLPLLGRGELLREPVDGRIVRRKLGKKYTAAVARIHYR